MRKSLGWGWRGRERRSWKRLDQGDPEGWDCGCPEGYEGEFGMQPPFVPVPGRGISSPGPNPGAGNFGGNCGCGGVCPNNPTLPPPPPFLPSLWKIPHGNTEGFPAEQGAFGADPAAPSSPQVIFSGKSRTSHPEFQEQSRFWSSWDSCPDRLYFPSSSA